jgi:hypothetical protein
MNQLILQQQTLVASCFLGAFPPVDLRAVCLVRAMSKNFGYLKKQQKISSLNVAMTHQTVG